MEEMEEEEEAACAWCGGVLRPPRRRGVGVRASVAAGPQAASSAAQRTVARLVACAIIAVLGMVR